MNDNKFHIRRLAKWRAESEALFGSLGLRPAQYMDLLGELADIGTEKIIARNSQFLFQFDDDGAVAIAERKGVSLRTVYYWREDELNMKCNFATGNCKTA